MTKDYLFLLRGVNVGGKHPVKMATLKDDLEKLNYSKVRSYINSGNLIFSSAVEKNKIAEQLKTYFNQHYPFSIPFILLEKNELESDFRSLPVWWQNQYYRKNVLFYLQDGTKAIKLGLIEQISNNGNEKIHFGKNAIFWAVLNEEDYQKSFYHKTLLTLPIYKNVTIRNEKTYQKLISMLTIKKD